MSDGSIEILGQKLAYPTTWYATVAVMIVCVALVIIAYLAKGWATPEILDGIKGITNFSAEQEKTITGLVENVEKLSIQMNALEQKVANAGTESLDESAKAALTKNQLERGLSISRLKEQLTNQSIVRLQEVVLAVKSEPKIEQQVQQYQIQQQQEVQQQQQIQDQLQQIQVQQ